MKMTQRWLTKLGDPPFIFSVVVTLIYYTIILQPAMKNSLLHRYTAEHYVEYGVVFLFFWGISDITLKFARFPRELLALRRDWMPVKSGKQPPASARELLSQIQYLPQWEQDSRIGVRLRSVLSFVVERESAEELNDHTRYLAEHDEEQTYRNYSVTRFVVAVTPILGFLGTVVHFGTALSGLTLSDVDNELSHVVSEMGTAFNTTAIALGSAMVTMFAMFLCERVESGIVTRINRFVEREFTDRFEVSSRELTPLFAILAEANEKYMQQTQRNAEQHLRVWESAFSSLLSRLDERRKEEEQRWMQSLVLLNERHSMHAAEIADRFGSLSVQLEARESAYFSQLRDALQQATSFSRGIERLTETLSAIALGEGRLLDLQQSLSDNLRLLRESGQIDGALHGLTAAIHLLTLRNEGSSLRKGA